MGNKKNSVRRRGNHFLPSILERLLEQPFDVELNANEAARIEKDLVPLTNPMSYPVLRYLRNQVVTFPWRTRTAPTILDRISRYKRNVKYCRSCSGPVHPLSRKDSLCVDCRRWENYAR